MQNKSVQTTPPEPAKAAAAAQHNLILENRHLATATGIKRIVSYDDTAASLETQQGGLTIGGRGIQVSELSLLFPVIPPDGFTGELKIYGQIDYVQYTEPQEKAERLLHRLWH